ncbi:hypothetical protein ABTX60_24940 [Streptomyces sp. NPDC126510]|uniref:hypothetical protein n=1 Tax=Streptomyces sp. NPDC126510 TaxID=3155317 RepID=UPI00332CA3EE
MTNQNHRLALAPGDGLRAEVLPPARRWPKAPVPCYGGTAWFLPSGGACDKAKDESSFPGGSCSLSLLPHPTHPHA